MKTIKERLAAHRATPPKQGAPVVPLAGFYRREGEFEAARSRFYSDCARVFGFDGWQFATVDPHVQYRAPYQVVRNQCIGLDNPVDIKVTTPFEWMLVNHKMGAKTKQVDSLQVQIADLYRRDLAMRAISPMKAVDPGAVGGGSSGPATIPDHRLDAMCSLGKLKDAMMPHLYKMLEEVLYFDVFVWEGRPEASHKAVFRTFMCALDCAGVHYGLLTQAELRRTWPGVDYDLPSLEKHRLRREAANARFRGP